MWTVRVLVAGVLVGSLATAVPAVAHETSGRHPARTYTNPVSAPFADTFADPSVIHADDGFWYAFGTSDPLRSGGEPAAIPTARSKDLVHWSYVGDVFSDANRPAWATATSGLWAPDIRHFGGRYVLYYTVTDTTLNGGDDSAIGMATAPSPAGPWTDSGAPVVAPRPAPGGGFLWTFDPAELTDASGHRWLYFGSYFGGIWVAPLSPDGAHTTGPAVQVAIDNRYEGAYVVRRGGWYYLFASAANCCAGPATGYTVFTGRSTSPTGPFVDRDGIPLLTSRVGGTIVITPNGNSWVGTGHNAIATDAAGQDWLVYHAIDRHQPYLNEPFGINRRPMLIDRLNWIGGWPTVRNGRGASDTPQPAPAVDRRGGTPAPPPVRAPHLGWLARGYSDEFSGSALGAGWTWVREDPAATVSGGAFRWPTEPADLVGPDNTASVLVRDAPAGDYVVETKLSIDLGEDTVRNFEQAGLVVYANDDDFARLCQVAIWNTRQVEYGRELPYAGGLPFGGMLIGTPAPTTWLRLAHHVDPATGEHRYRAASSRDGHHWTWGGAWTFPAGTAPRIGLVSQGGNTPPATAVFDYFRVYR